MSQTRRSRPKTQRVDLLQADVAAMIGDAETLDKADRLQLAHDIIVVVRERVLRELASYARENVR